MIGKMTLALVVATAAAVTFTPAARAAVLFTTQDDFTGFSGLGAGVAAVGDTDGSTVNGLGNTTNAGGTGVAGALALTVPAGTTYGTSLSPGEQANAGFLSALSGSTVTVDYTATVAGGNYFQLLILLNGSGPGFDAISPTSTTGTMGGPQTSTYTLPVISPTQSYFQFGFVANTNDVGAITVDNVQTPSAVPEPASLAVLGLGGLATMRRRRV